MRALVSISQLLAALADPTRLRILHLLWRAEPGVVAVGTLVDVLERPQPTVSRHLAHLRRYGLVRRVQRGRARLYGLAERQPHAHRALLSALEELVPATPMAVRDLERLAARRARLTGTGSSATNRLHERDAQPQPSPGDDAMTTVLGALSHPTRRRLLDEIASHPGACLGEIAGGHATSRAAIGKHLAVLERADLVVSIREAGRRRLYANRVPVQVVYDRWMTRLGARWSQHVAAIKAAVERRPA